MSSSICDEEVSSWLGPHGAVQAAARWSIIYYRTSLLLRYVTNALRRDGLPEVNAARLTPLPSDKHCQCSIQEKLFLSQISGRSTPNVARGVFRDSHASPKVQ